MTFPMDKIPVNLTKTYEIYPKPTYTMLYVGGDSWLCEGCGGVQQYQQKSYEGPSGACPHCGEVQNFVQTTLKVRVPPCTPPSSQNLKS